MRAGTAWLWRAVDQHGVVLDILVQSRSNAKAAKRLLRKLLKKQGILPSSDDHTDELASYGAAKRKIIMPSVEHRQHKGLNNRAENRHISRRDDANAFMKCFKSAGQAQRFLLSPRSSLETSSPADPPTPPPLIIWQNQGPGLYNMAASLAAGV